MIRAARSKRGQPLVAMGFVLGSWVVARVMLFSSADASLPIAATQLAEPQAVVEHLLPITTPAQTDDEISQDASADLTAMSQSALAEPAPLPHPSAMPVQMAHLPAPVFVAKSVPVPIPALAQAPVASIEPDRAPAPVRAAAGHQLLWMAALAHLPLPHEVPASPVRRASASPHKLSRWSADGWLLWRRARTVGETPSGFAPPAYGASQAGAVLRFRLDPADPYRPTLYLRATRALQHSRGEEVALGLSARPIAKLPISAAAELRATHFSGGIKLRPAAALISEFPPLELPFKVRAEAYVQAGWVLSPGASRFVDGQLRIDRPLTSHGKTTLRVGGGLWGGAQRGVARLDAGPSATLALPLSDGNGAATARVAMDWRFRLAGNAAPRSGPAITLSAGF